MEIDQKAHVEEDQLREHETYKEHVASKPKNNRERGRLNKESTISKPWNGREPMRTRTQNSSTAVRRHGIGNVCKRCKNTKNAGLPGCISDLKFPSRTLPADLPGQEHCSASQVTSQHQLQLARSEHK